MQEFNRDRPKDLIGIDIPEDILEIRMPGKVFFRVKCDCPCHDPDNVMMHCFPCCDNGWMWRERQNNSWISPAQSEYNGLLFGQKTEYSAIHGKWVNGKWSVEYIKASKEDTLLDRYLQYLSNLE